jgi:hypothetical protein
MSNGNGKENGGIPIPREVRLWAWAALFLLGADPASHWLGARAGTPASINDNADFRELCVNVRALVKDVGEVRDDSARLWQRLNDQQSTIANLERDNVSQDEKIRKLEARTP